jgi:hypothetical protein
LANPGAVAFREELERVTTPDDKFLLISIFGRDADEYAQVARILAPVADGFELNMSCPHAAGYGIENYGRRGRINARELHEQMNSCSCLTLILACVIYWQAKEISRVVRWCHTYWTAPRSAEPGA